MPFGVGSTLLLLLDDCLLEGVMEDVVEGVLVVVEVLLLTFVSTVRFFALKVILNRSCVCCFLLCYCSLLLFLL